MRAYAKTFLIGWLMVTLVSANTKQIASNHYFGAFLVGCAISLVWGFGVRHVAKSETAHIFCYALGAGFGTLSGMLLMHWLYGGG